MYSNWGTALSSNFIVKSYFNGFVDISGGNLISRNNFFVGGDTSMNGNLNLGGNMQINSNLIVNGTNSFIYGNVSIGKSSNNYALDISGNVNLENNSALILGNSYIVDNGVDGLAINNLNDISFYINGNNIINVNETSINVTKSITIPINNALSWNNNQSSICDNGNTFNIITNNTNTYIDSNLIVNGNLDVYGTTFTNRISITSDYRIKDNVTDIYGNSNIDKLQPRIFYNKLTHEKEFGFIAHEVQKEIPSLVYGIKDGDEYQKINYMQFIPLIIKEIQDLRKEIKVLKNRE